MIPNFIGLLESWCRNAPRQNEASIHFSIGPVDRPKRSAWAEIENDRVTAQVTVWVTGECEAEVDSIRDGRVLLRRSQTVATEEDLTSVLDEVMSYL